MPLNDGAGFAAAPEPTTAIATMAATATISATFRIRNLRSLLCAKHPRPRKTPFSAQNLFRPRAVMIPLLGHRADVYTFGGTHDSVKTSCRRCCQLPRAATG